MVGRTDKNNTLVEIRDGAFSFGQTLIFKQVNLQIAKGEIFCLLGPNGCGKTTLIDCVLGILRLDRAFPPGNRTGYGICPPAA